MPYSPAARTLHSTACEMSDSRAPGRAAASPCHSARSQSVISLACPAEMTGTPTVSAASACQPSTLAPQSMETTSPSRSTREALGIPCTISSLTQVQIVGGEAGGRRGGGGRPGGARAGRGRAGGAGGGGPGAPAPPPPPGGQPLPPRPPFASSLAVLAF